MAKPHCVLNRKTAVLFCRQQRIVEGSMHSENSDESILSMIKRKEKKSMFLPENSFDISFNSLRMVFLQFPRKVSVY